MSKDRDMRELAGKTNVCKAAIEGAIVATGYAEIKLQRALANYGPDTEVAFPTTGYELPFISGLGGDKVTKLGELPSVLNKYKKNIQHKYDLEHAKLAGETTAIAAEIIEALKYVEEEKPYEDEIYMGFVNDKILREYGIDLVDFTIPGEAVIMGKADDPEKLAEMINELQSMGILTFLCDEVVDQAVDQGVKMGVEFYTLPLGHFTQVVHAVNFAMRSALAFGGEERGDYDAVLDYIRERIRGFVIALGDQDEVEMAAQMAASHLGMPTITNQDDVEEIEDRYIVEEDYDEMVQLGLELRDIHIEIVDIPVPITVGAAFEGQQIRSDDMYVEFGGQRTTAFELVKKRDKDEVEDGNVELIGPDIDEVEEGGQLPLGIMVDIYGRDMQEDFEGVLERQTHHFCNYGEGLWHMGQRDINWIRISKEAKEAGFTIKGIGEILYAKFKSEFPSIIDRLQIRLITDQDKVEEKLEEAKARYDKRDERMEKLSDESVDVFYDCTLCQSFAPDHVCVVTPDRVGLCGAISWLDAQAAYEIDPAGPNQPIELGETIDEEKGQWEGCNKRTEKESGGNVTEVNLYSMMESPMTSCGCFEAIMAMVPEANGIMIVNREHGGQTPVGMTFSTLAGSVGGGNQTPGFMGIGKTYVTSDKFIQADGGIARIIWMPKEFKEQLEDDIKQRAKEEGLGEDFYDKIADETVGTAAEEILPYLQEKGHPALDMDPLM
ncbi:acetyl-CoA decarbonylase/synthase complex subunit alpha/beta [Acetohalobium arabaticum]|uniref:CO-methylating acetyl-CoA synthase n=1 Tax=Acetohalobium arabaticum (strain ATCC 49924 / DSM 5501 / Z-7288) TaxID=574087 RepID=D9QQM6_ACEAZ|nr:acetyl-CoA decarbonylase/synthase complex subunit alpha/beta [Acetohalobium arabaticum]ADL12817.1 CO dehydrogenase/acetyl-CoA synthase complex, beta subunit [Acetohalobium arabaticum DSM 5501]